MRSIDDKIVSKFDWLDFENEENHITFTIRKKHKHYFEEVFFKINIRRKIMKEKRKTVKSKLLYMVGGISIVVGTLIIVPKLSGA